MSIARLGQILEREIVIMLSDISKTYNISIEELRSRYLPIAETDTLPPKKRGRKKKQKDEYIDTEEYEYDGTIYLVDDKNTVYTNDVEAPTVVGERLVDGTIHFYSKD
jgi:hypothetical protein